MQPPLNDISLPELIFPRYSDKQISGNNYINEIFNS